MAAGVELHVPAPFADIPVLEDMAIDSIVLCSTRLPINGGGGDVSAAGQGLNKRETWRQSTTSHSSSSLFPPSPRIPGLKPKLGLSVRQRDTSVVYRGCRDSKAYGGQNGGASERHGWVAPHVTLYTSCASLSASLCAVECLRCLD